MSDFECRLGLDADYSFDVFGALNAQCAKKFHGRDGGITCRMGAIGQYLEMLKKRRSASRVCVKISLVGPRIVVCSPHDKLNE